MGSRRGKKLGKRILIDKSKLKLNSQQMSVIVGSMLGDGTIQTGKNAINSNLKIEQCLAQKEYVFWKYSFFKEWVSTPPKLSYRYTEDRIKYQKSWWFRTVRHPEITVLRKYFYPDGRKIVPKDINKYLNSLALAIWIMDDGSFNKNKYDISTYSFNENEVNILQIVLKENFDLDAKYFMDRDKGIRMYFNKKQTNKIASLISPYIVSCMKYKLPLLTP